MRAGKTVVFEFSHPFCKIIVNVSDQLPDDTISKVEIKGLVMEGTIDIIAGSVSLGTAKKSFYLSKLSEGRFAAAVMPQDASPTIVISTSKGVTYLRFIFRNGLCSRFLQRRFYHRA